MSQTTITIQNADILLVAVYAVCVVFFLLFAATVASMVFSFISDYIKSNKDDKEKDTNA